MALSGVQVQPVCAEVFTKIKLGHQFRYVVYSLTNDFREITVLKTAQPDATFDEFVDDLMEAETAQECRYAVYDAEFTLPDGQNRSKLVFFLWSPGCAKIRQKMVYTSSKDYLKRALVGIAKEIQAGDRDDLLWSNVLEVCMRGDAGVQTLHTGPPATRDSVCCA